MRKMKDSGIAWLGEIPEEWETKKARFLFQQRLTKGSKSEVLLASTQQYGIIPQYKIEGAVKVKEETDLQLFKSVKRNDFVISLRSFQGGIGHSEYDGVCSPAYQVFFNIIPLNHYFFKYLFKSDSFISIINSLSIGIRDGKNIQYKDVECLYLPFPPIPEQCRIASYLDAKCAEIDHSMELVRQSMDKLKEYKMAVITEAVTKGLDPDVPMKDSGVPWIGEIPEGWLIQRMKNIATIARGGSPRPIEDYLTYDEAGLNWIKIGDTIKGYKFIDQVQQKIRIEGLPKTRFVHKGDLILTNSMSFGEPYILNIEGCIHDGWVCLQYIKINILFLYYLLCSQLCIEQFKLLTSGGVVQKFKY